MTVIKVRSQRAISTRRYPVLNQMHSFLNLIATHYGFPSLLLHRLVVLVNPPSKKIKSKKFKKCLTHSFRVMYTSDECVNPLCNILNYLRNAHCSIDIAKGNVQLFAKYLTQVARRRTEWVHVGNQEEFFSQITQID